MLAAGGQRVIHHRAGAGPELRHVPLGARLRRRALPQQGAAVWILEALAALPGPVLRWGAIGACMPGAHDTGIHLPPQ